MSGEVQASEHVGRTRADMGSPWVHPTKNIEATRKSREQEGTRESRRARELYMDCGQGDSPRTAGNGVKDRAVQTDNVTERLVTERLTN